MTTPQTQELDALFTSCIQRQFTGADIANVKKTCSTLANLCTYSGVSFVASKHWIKEFKERQKELGAPADGKKADKALKKQEKKAKKAAKKDKKKAKKKAKKDKKKKGKGKKHKKLSKKDKKKAKKKAKKDKKKAKKQKKEAKEQAKKEKKEAEKNMDPAQKEAEKKDKKEAKAAKKVAKKEAKAAKKAAKKEKKAAKFSKKEKKLAKKLIKEEDNLHKKELKLADKALSLLDKKLIKEGTTCPLGAKKRAATIKDLLQGRDKSVSRYAACLTFVPEESLTKQKDDLDAKCIALKKASEAAYQAEQCWARYIDLLEQCKAQTKKKKNCFRALGDLDKTCSQLAKSSEEHLLALNGKKEQEVK